MSNKLEAALGGGYTFTDAEDDEFGAHSAQWRGKPTVRLSVNAPDDKYSDIEFYKADAAKIIALIAEAAK